MILSLRRNYGNRFFFGEPSIKERSGAIVTGDAAIDRLEAACYNKRVLFLVHGYNSTAEAAEESYAIIEAKLREHGMLGRGCIYETCVGILWPGRTTPGYMIAEAAAGAAAKKLAPILASLDCAAVSIETHSLGAKVALDMLLREESPAVDDLVMTAAATDGESIQIGERYERSIVKCERALVCFSRNDSVLGRAYRFLGSLLRNPLSIGDTALGANGPDDAHELPKNVSLLDGSEFVMDHSAWRHQDKFYEAWAVFRESKHVSARA